MLDQYGGVTAFKAGMVMTCPSNTARASDLGEVAMVTPLLLIMVVLTTGWGWVPKRWMTIPFSTGQGSLPFWRKLAASCLASGVRQRHFGFSRGFVRGGNGLSNQRSISRSIAAALRCFCLISLLNERDLLFNPWISRCCDLRSCCNCCCASRFSITKASFWAFCSKRIWLRDCRVLVFS